MASRACFPRDPKHLYGFRTFPGLYKRSLMSTQLDLRIVELLCSRLCHDLVSPIGAVNNGIELLEDSNPEMAGEVLPLITSSARQAWRRLDFFRVAFGYGGGRDGWSVPDLRGYAAGLLEGGGKVTLNWPADASRDARSLEGRAGKLLLNLILLGAEGLPRGGQLSVAVLPVPQGWRLGVSASGPMILLHERVHQALLGQVPSEDVDARTVQAFFTLHLAHEMKGTLATERRQDTLSFSFSPGV